MSEIYVGEARSEYLPDIITQGGNAFEGPLNKPHDYAVELRNRFIDIQKIAYCSPSVEIASIANCRICVTIAFNPLLRVGERCSSS